MSYERPPTSSSARASKEFSEVMGPPVSQAPSARARTTEAARLRAASGVSASVARALPAPERHPLDRAPAVAVPVARVDLHLGAQAPVRERATPAGTELHADGLRLAAGELEARGAERPPAAAQPRRADAALRPDA